jgi:hypothetical protein
MKISYCRRDFQQAGIVIVLFLFLGVTAYAEDAVISDDEFRLLTPEQQVELLLSELN